MQNVNSNLPVNFNGHNQSSDSCESQSSIQDFCKEVNNVKLSREALPKKRAETPNTLNQNEIQLIFGQIINNKASSQSSQVPSNEKKEQNNSMPRKPNWRIPEETMNKLYKDIENDRANGECCVTINQFSQDNGVSKGTVKRAISILRLPKEYRTNSLSPAEEEQLIKGYKSGSSLNTLAKKFKIPLKTVKTILANAGVMIRPKYLTEERKNALDHDIKKRVLTLSQLSKKHGICENSIWKRRKMLGLTMAYNTAMLLSQIETDHLIQGYKSGLSLNTLANKHNISVDAAKAILVNNGIEIRTQKQTIALKLMLKNQGNLTRKQISENSESSISTDQKMRAKQHESVEPDNIPSQSTSAQNDFQNTKESDFYLGIFSGKIIKRNEADTANFSAQTQQIFDQAQKRPANYDSQDQKNGSPTKKIKV